MAAPDRRHLGGAGAGDRHAALVRLQLQQQVHDGGSTVGAKPADWPAAQLRHRVERRRGTGRRSPRPLPGRGALVRFPCVMPITVPRACGVPPRASETREGRHEIDAVVTGDLGCERSGLGRLAITPSPSRSHWMVAPEEKTAPSSAYEKPPPSRPERALRGPRRRWSAVPRPAEGASAPRFMRTKLPVP